MNIRGEKPLLTTTSSLISCNLSISVNLLFINCNRNMVNKAMKNCTSFSFSLSGLIKTWCVGCVWVWVWVCAGVGVWVSVGVCVCVCVCAFIHLLALLLFVWLSGIS